MQHILVVSADDAILQGLPRRVGSGASSVPLRFGTSDDLGADGVVGAVLVDTQPVEVEQATRTGLPLLVDLTTLRRVLEQTDGLLLEAARWVPMLPLRLAVDVIAVERLLAEDRWGRVIGGEVVTLVGQPTHGSWELDHHVARTPFEALAHGVDVLATLHQTICFSRASVAAPPALRMEHHTAGGATFSHWVLPAEAASAPEFRASLVCERATVWLRAPFAPSSVTLWDNASERYRSIRLHRETANIQAPDTVRGGLSTQRLLAGLLNDDDAGDRRLRDAGIHAVRAAADLLVECTPSSERPPG